MTVALRRSWAKDLDAATLYELLKLRVEVFVVEQAIPYPELDGRDLLAETRHFWLEGPDGEVISTLRLMEEHAGGEKAFRIGRVCTKRSARGHGHTTRLLQAALAEVGDYPCRINAQTYLEDMYAHHGFVRDGEEFLDDGIPHVPMVRLGVPQRGRAAVTYPFSAIVGHDQLRLALVLCAVRPEIGGVLIRGEKGTAKSTAVRGLAQVLAAVDGAPPGRTADRRHRGPRGRLAGPAAGAARRRARVQTGTAGPRPRRRALCRRGQSAARPPGRRAARRRGDGPGARRARRRFAQPRGPIRPDRHHEPRRGRAAAAAAGPVRPHRRRARIARCRGARGGRSERGWPSRPTPKRSPAPTPKPTPSWPAASPRPGRRSPMWRCRTTSYAGSRRCARRSMSTGCGRTWWSPGPRWRTLPGAGRPPSPRRTSGWPPNWRCRTGAAATRSTTRAWIRTGSTRRWRRPARPPTIPTPIRPVAVRQHPGNRRNILDRNAIRDQPPGPARRRRRCSGPGRWWCRVSGRARPAGARAPATAPER